MKAYLLLTLPLFCVAPGLVAPQVAAAQEAISTPSTRNGPSVGFSYGAAGGVYRNRAGDWESREYPTVQRLQDGSPAARAGVRAGDVIISVDGRDSRRLPVFRGLQHGQVLVLRVRRGDAERVIRVQLGD